MWRRVGLVKNDVSEERIISIFIFEARGSAVFKALCYKLQGRGFETRW
jgi:hypothetical protein